MSAEPERFSPRPVRPDPDGLVEGMRRVPDVLKLMGFDSLRPHQQCAVSCFMAGRDALVIVPTAGGKCFGVGTPILKFDGEVVPVEAVKPGDRLMGPDGRPRTVTSTCVGREPMYRVLQQRGESYVVNESHILSLKVTTLKDKEKTYCGGVAFRSGDVANVTVRDYLAGSRNFRHVTYGWASPGIPEFDRVAATFPIPPYIMGLWLGDGSVGKFGITKPDPEIGEAVRAYAESIGHRFRAETSADRCTTWCVSYPEGAIKGRGHRSNEPKKVLWEMGLLDKEHGRFIPSSYKLANREARLQVLAGLLDSDGSLKDNRGSYDWISKHEQLARDVVFVARSLGFRATLSGPVQKINTTTGVGGLYWRVYLSGRTWELPLRIPRKRAPELHPRKDPLVGRIALEALGEGDYYGFTLEGPDRLFLLGDFTVVHNTASFVVPTLARNWRALVFSPLQALMRDQVQGLQRRWAKHGPLLRRLGYMDPPVDYMSDQRTSEENRNAAMQWAAGNLALFYVAPERLANPDFLMALRTIKPDAIFVDEAHCVSSWGFNFRPHYTKVGDFIREFDPKVVGAFTATAGKQVQDDIKTVLGLQNAAVEKHWVRRTNLHLQSEDLDDDMTLVSRLRAVRDQGSCLVYGSSKKKLNELQAQLSSMLPTAEIGIYHADLIDTDRIHHQELFMDGHSDIMLATCAFGMGIDKPDIRTVIHYHHPASIEALSQECVHPDSMISTASGIKVATEVALGEEMLDYRFDVGEAAPAMATKTMENQAEKLIQIRTKLGSTLRVSPRHPVFMRTAGGVLEIPAADLQIGDQLLAQRHLPPSDPTSVDVVGLLLDCPEPVFVKVRPELVDRLREKLSPVEVSEYFRLSRPYDYNAYKEKKHGRLDYWLEACAAVGISPSELRDNITHFKTRSSRSIVLPVTLPPDFGWWLGIVATDGSVSRVAAGGSKGYGSWRVRLGSTNDVIADKFAEIAEALGVKAHRYTRHPDGSSLTKQVMNMVECSHPILVHLCNKAGIPSGKKSYSVSVPKWLRSADAPLRAGFIAGVIDGDGCLAKDTYQLRIHSAAWDFLSGVSMLMRGFGIPATCYAEDYTHKADVMTTGADHGYSLRVTSTEHYEQLRDVVSSYSCKSWQPVRLPNVGQDMTKQRKCRRPTITLPGGDWLQDEILEKREVDYVGRVLNWRVEPGNQLVVDGILTHNCGRAGRDGLDSLCLTYYSSIAGRIQQDFIRDGYPDPSNIKSFYQFLRTRQDRSGELAMTVKDMAAAYGRQERGIGAILKILEGERVIEREASSDTVFRIAFLMDSANERFEAFRMAVQVLGVPDHESKLGHLRVDFDRLQQELGKSAQTVRNWVKDFEDEGLVHVIRPYRGSTTRLVDDLSRVDFDAIQLKSDMAWKGFRQVLEYHTIPDHDKHEFLEEAFY